MTKKECFCQECREQCKICRALDRKKAKLTKEHDKLKSLLDRYIDKYGILE